MQSMKIRPFTGENEFALLVPFSKILPLYVVDYLLAPGKISTMLLMTKCQVTLYDFFVH